MFLAMTVSLAVISEEMELRDRMRKQSRVRSWIA